MKVACFVLFLSVQFILSSSAILGIDYGQNFLKGIVVSPQAPMEIVLTPESKRKDVNGLAIKVWSDENIERIYGLSATTSMFTKFPGSTFMHLKSLLGKLAEENLSMYHKEHPGIVINGTNRGSILFSTEGREYALEDLVSMTLSNLISRANEMLDDDDSVNTLAMTIPDYFTIEQRNSLTDSISLIPIYRPYLISEGMSVAINFVLKERNFEKGKLHYYIIYDMGHGSTKASLISVYQDYDEVIPLKIEFLGYGYTTDISGSHFTLAIANLIQNKFLESNNHIRTESLLSSPKALAKIMQAAEKIKLILSANMETSINIESIFEEIDFKVIITRKELEDFMEEIFPSIIDPIMTALANPLVDFDKIGLNQVTSVILTGGSVRVPVVQKYLLKYLGENRLSKSVNADESAVNGAIIRGIQLSKYFKVKPINIIDRSIYCYSIKTNHTNEYYTVFSRGSSYPNTSSILIPDVESIDESLEIEMMEGGRHFKSLYLKRNSTRERELKEICQFNLFYNVTFTLSENRIFECDRIEALCINDTRGNISDESTQLDKNLEAIKKISSYSKTLSFSQAYIHLEPLSTLEKVEKRTKLKEWNFKDKQRIQLQEQLNILESNLYDARYYLEEENVLEYGPQKNIQNLIEMVSQYLEWLDYESNNAELHDISSKISNISLLKNKIELYIESLDDPLDIEQFNAFYQNGLDILTSFKDYKQKYLNEIYTWGESFEFLGLNFTKEYLKIKPPKHVNNISTKNLYSKIESFEQILMTIKNLLDNNLFQSKIREDLFELKLMFSDKYKELGEVIDVYNNIHAYRFKELKLWCTKKIRAIKKNEKESKLKEITNSTISEESTLTDINTETTVTADDLGVDHDEL